MSHRRPEPRQAVLERTLRHALRLAADSVEPRDDGLARIRAKIALGQPAPRVRWWTTPYARAWYYLEPPAIWLRYAAGDAVQWLRYAAGAVAERLLDVAADVAHLLRRAAEGFAARFSPDRGPGGWVRWLRPAAGLATVLLVVTGVSWAATGLQQAIVNSSNPNVGGGGPGGSIAPGPSNHRSSYPYTSPGSSKRTSNHSAMAAASCRAGSRSPSPPGSASPTATPSTSSSSSPSPSPSPSPSTSSSTSSSPSPSPSSSPSSMATGSGPSAQAGGLAAARQLAAAEQTAATSKLPTPGIDSRCA